MEEILDINSIKKKMLRKYPTFGSTINSVKYEVVGNNHQVKTASTDGSTIFINADFMRNLSEDDQMFVLSHEVCHIALNHLKRSENKDKRLWNIATDAIINQHLLHDGLPILKDAINIKDALNYDAEELYEKLLLEQEQQKKSNKQSKEKRDNQNQQDNQNNQEQQSKEQKEEKKEEKKECTSCDNKDKSGQDQCKTGDEKDNQVGHDNHSMWDEALKKSDKEQSQSNKDEQNQEQEPQKISEKAIFSQNEQTKIENAEKIMSKINSQRRGVCGFCQEVTMSDIGTASKPVTNWKKLLRQTLEIEDEAWGHKFSDRNSGYRARIEDVEYDEKAETEVILDTSGSISVDLLKNFLRQVKTVLKNSDIRVGTFSSDFHGWTNIEKEADISTLRIKVGGGTNFNAASKAFTKRREVNKICFTDGQDGGDAKIENKRKDIVWVCFDNPNFKPDNGKVIIVSKELINLKTNKEPELTM